MLWIVQTELLIKEWPCDLITNTDAAEILSGEKGSFLSQGMRHALEDLKCVSPNENITIEKKSHRYWILRNTEAWLRKSSKERGKEARETTGTSLIAASEILAKAIEDKGQDKPF